MFSFDTLISSISTADHFLQTESGKAINKSPIARNWLIGLYIIEFENGENRAEYGSKLLVKLTSKLKGRSLSYRFPMLLNKDSHFQNTNTLDWTSLNSH